MTELVYHQDEQQGTHHPKNEPRSHHAVKTTTSAIAGGSLLVLSGLTFTSTILALIVVTPLVVIFSPVLVPAVIIIFLLATGFLTSILLALAGTMVLAWLYKFVTSDHPANDSSDQVTQTLALNRQEIKDNSDDTRASSHHATEGGQHEALKAVTRFLVSLVLGGPTTMVLTWLYKYFTGEHPRGAYTLDHTIQKLGSKAKEIRDKGARMTQVIDRKEVARKTTKMTVGGYLLVLSGLTFVGTVVGLVLVTPLLVIFSPVLMSAVITVFVLLTGFLLSGVLGVLGVTVLVWLYRYVNDRHPTGEDSLDQAGHKLGLMGREMRMRGEDAIEGHYATGDVHDTNGLKAY